MTDKTFLGMPITGEDIYRDSYKKAEQYSVEHFQNAVTQVLSHSVVLGLSWDQYTPYYNDGEPCVFRVGELSFLFEGIQNCEGYEYDEYWQQEEAEEDRYWCGKWSNSSEFDRIVGNTDKVYSGTGYPRPFKYKIETKDQPNPQLFLDVTTLMNSVDAGHYDNALLNLFGDHVRVMIDKTANKVILESYEHE